MHRISMLKYVDLFVKFMFKIKYKLPFQWFSFIAEYELTNIEFYTSKLKVSPVSSSSGSRKDVILIRIRKKH